MYSILLIIRILIEDTRMFTKLWNNHLIAAKILFSPYEMLYEAHRTFKSTLEALPHETIDIDISHHDRYIDQGCRQWLRDRVVCDLATQNFVHLNS